MTYYAGQWLKWTQTDQNQVNNEGGHLPSSSAILPMRRPVLITQREMSNRHTTYTAIQKSFIRIPTNRVVNHSIESDNDVVSVPRYQTVVSSWLLEQVLCGSVLSFLVDSFHVSRVVARAAFIGRRSSPGMSINVVTTADWVP